jgi:hypothetical protein
MQIAIISTALSIVLFSILYLGFRTGLRLGQSVARGNTIPPIKNPIQAIQEHRENKEQAKADKEYNEGLQAILNYTGDEIPKERK